MRHYILKNPAILLADSIWDHNSKPRVFPDMGLVLNINSNISFHFRLFSRKTIDKIFQQKKQQPILGPFGPFLPNFGQKLISWEK